MTGIEPALSAWEAEVLPLNYTRAARNPSKTLGSEAAAQTTRSMVFGQTHRLLNALRSVPSLGSLDSNDGCRSLPSGLVDFQSALAILMTSIEMCAMRLRDL